MSLSHAWLPAKAALQTGFAQQPLAALDEQHPGCVLFFSLSDGRERARVRIAVGETFDQAWQQGTSALQQHAVHSERALWLRVDCVDHVEALPWLQMKARIAASKRSYFRFGLAFDAGFQVALLEQELYGNAILYDGKCREAAPNAINLANYSKRRFGHALHWPQQDDHVIWRFQTRAVFSDGERVHRITPRGRHSGYREITDWGPERVRATIDSGSDYLARQVKADGRYQYGWFPCFDRPIPAYNSLRHASATYALLESWELTRSPMQEQAIERALDCLAQTLIQRLTLPDGSEAAFLVDTGNEIKLGGNAVCLLAFAKYTEITADQRWLPLMEALALGILHMQNADSGAFVHVLRFPDLSVKAERRTIYYDGEAAFGLMRLYGLTQNARWLQAVERAFTHFIASGHEQAHDHWLSYCVNELTRYRPEETYYRFGLANVRDHLDFVLKRITTYPTLLELMMAAQAMLERLQQDSEHAHLLEGFDFPRFYRALEYRARYLLTGFFWPELAMFFNTPERIVGSFFIRHHAFRVRIDDVEHYLSGYVAYWKYRTALAARPGKLPATQAVMHPPVQAAQPCLQSAADLARLTGGQWLQLPTPDWSSSGLCIHPASFSPGQLLCARGDLPRAYLADAVLPGLAERGAAGILCQAPFVPALNQLPVLQVPDLKRALMAIGRQARSVFQGAVIGVTGSAGKTTTVAMLAEALRAFGPVGETRESANLPVGIAWNQASMPPDARHWVLEMAIGHMATNSELVRPQVAVVTNVAPAHLEYHHSTETIAVKKARIFDSMAAGGTAVVCRDSLHFEVFAEAARKRGLALLSYGRHAEADIRLLGCEGDWQAVTADVVWSFRLSAGGEHLALNALAVVAVLRALGLLPEAGLQRLTGFQPVAGRGREYRLCREGLNITLRDEAYNANPLSMRAALAALADSTVSPASRVLVLGDMRELGEDSADYHRDLKAAILQVQPDRLLLCGAGMQVLWEALAPELQVGVLRGQWFRDVTALTSALPLWLHEGDTLLFKASHSVGLQRLVRQWVADYGLEARMETRQHAPPPAPQPRLEARAVIECRGDGQQQSFGNRVRLVGARIVLGAGARLHLGDGVLLRGYWAVSAGCSLYVGAGTKCNFPVHAVVSENTELVIGEGCLLSDVTFYTSDTHGIYDRQSGQRLNPAASIRLGDRVWMARRSSVLKGACIGSDVVVAAGAIVTGNIPDHSLCAGVPARVVREGIVWRDRPEDSLAIQAAESD